MFCHTVHITSKLPSKFTNQDTCFQFAKHQAKINLKKRVIVVNDSLKDMNIWSEIRNKSNRSSDQKLVTIIDNKYKLRVFQMNFVQSVSFRFNTKRYPYITYVTYGDV